MCNQKNQCCSTTATSETARLLAEKYALSVKVELQEKELSRLLGERKLFYTFATELVAISEGLQLEVKAKVADLALKAFRRGVQQDAGSLEKQRRWTSALWKLSERSGQLLRLVQRDTASVYPKVDSCCQSKTTLEIPSDARYVAWMADIQKACRTLSRG